MIDVEQYIEKEISWLSFNERVLQEAADKTVPVVERVRFLGIFSSNMDEFFRVRVAAVRRRLLIERDTGEGNPKALRRLLKEIQEKVLELQQNFDNIYMEIIIALARHSIFLISESQLSDDQGVWLRQHFKDKILRHVSPIVISNRIDLDKSIKDDLTYLVAELRSKDNTEYVLLEVPSDKCPRFLMLPHEKGQRKKSMILLDNIIRYCLDDIFRGFFEFEEISAFSMKMTRDAEFNLGEDAELSLLEKMSVGVKQRLNGQPVRFVYDRDMPETMIKFITKQLGITSYDSLIPGGRYHNFRDFIGFPNVGRKYLEHPKQPALHSAAFDKHETIFKAITAGDILLYYPYHKFSYFTEFVRQASYDPSVVEMKMSIYRVAKNSRIIKSLIDAAENGKVVTVVIELQARFDEQANIAWAKELTEAGIKVDFGVPSLKCHTKLFSVTRIENEERVSYCHIGTGNFHEKTAKIYTDFSLFTKNVEINNEANNVFDFIINPYKQHKFDHLVVSPTDTRKRLYALIDDEIASAEAGKRAEIFVKVNNLVDKGIAQRLYKASSVGVRVRLIVRGMMSMLAGVPKLSTNIEARSIVDRYLEHPRVFIFYANGKQKTFISSADWMTRNIDKRVEVGCPIYDEKLKRRIRKIMEIQWSDTTKARIIDKEQQNHYVARGNRKKIRSQVTIYEYLKDIELADLKK